MQNDTVVGYWASLAPSVYVTVPSNFWETIAAGAFGSVLGALAAGSVSYFIFIRTENNQNRRDKEAHKARAQLELEAREAQAARDEELRQFQIQLTKNEEIIRKNRHLQN